MAIHVWFTGSCLKAFVAVIAITSLTLGSSATKHRIQAAWSLKRVAPAETVPHNTTNDGQVTEDAARSLSIMRQPNSTGPQNFTETAAEPVHVPTAQHLVHHSLPHPQMGGTSRSPESPAANISWPIAPYSEWPPEGPQKRACDSKFEPASHCGTQSPLTFRSRFSVPHQRKCVSDYMDVPLFSILLGNPTAAARDQVADVKGRLSTEWLALWDGASHVTHSQKAHHGPWQATLNGPNDFLIYSKGKLTNADVADRLLKSTAARLSLLVMDAENDLARLTKAWMLNAAALFGQHPRLGVIGMAAQQSARGFAFTADAGAGPWLVRRDAMIEAGAVGFVDFCTGGNCTLQQGLAGLAWTGGFQVGQLSEDAVAWPVAPMDPPRGSLNGCAQVGSNTVDTSAIANAAEAAQSAMEAGASTSGALAASSACRSFQVQSAQVQGTEAQCGQDHNAPIIHASILVQYFQRPIVIKSLLASLAGIKVPHEVIVNDDSRSEHDQWLSRLGGRGFLFHSPNVHEIRGYNRLARFARGDLIIMMQDDDQPKNGQWVKNALGLFNAHNRMGMLGGLRGRMDVGSSHDKETNQNNGKKYGPRFLKIKNRCPVTDLPFMFMYKVNAAPLVARRRVMMQLGGLQEAFSCPGDAGIGFDFEYSIRLWRTGYQVGLYDVDFNRPQPGKRGKAGTRSNAKKWNIRRDNEILNNGLLYKMYPGFHHGKGTKVAMSALATLK